MDRPTREDEEALNLLLANDSIDERSAEFLESLAERKWTWTVKQCAWFDHLCDRFF